VWDVDDVLNPLMRDWLEYQKQLGSVCSKFEYADLINPDFSETLGWPRQKFLFALDEFRLKFQRRLEPNKLIKNWFRQNQAMNVKHVALTATPRTVSDVSRDWVSQNFGEFVDDFHLAPSARDTDLLPRKRKQDFYMEFKAEYREVIAIDDRPDNLNDARDAGISILCWPQPWNGSLLDSESTLKELSKMIIERS